MSTVNQNKDVVVVFTGYRDGTFELDTPGNRTDNRTINQINFNNQHVIQIKGSENNQQTKSKDTSERSNILLKALVVNTVVMGSYMAAGSSGVGALFATGAVIAARKPLWSVVKFGSKLLGKVTVGCVNAASYCAANGGAALYCAANSGAALLNNVSTVVGKATKVSAKLVEGTGKILEVSGAALKRVAQEHSTTVGAATITASMLGAAYFNGIFE